MIFEIHKERRQYAEALRALVNQHADECHEGHAPTLVALRQLADVLEAGKLALLRPVFQCINKRLFGTLVGREIARQHGLIRKKIRTMGMTAQGHDQDPELSELAYVLATANKVLGIDPSRSTLLSDRTTRVSYSQFFHHVVVAAVSAVFPDAASAGFGSERRSA